MGNTETILIEVETIRPATAAGNGLDKLGAGASYVSGGAGPLLAPPIEGLHPDDLQRNLATICSAIGNAMRDAAPDSWAVEFSLGFKAGAKVPVLMSGEANAALKVTLGWKKA